MITYHIFGDQNDCNFLSFVFCTSVSSLAWIKNNSHNLVQCFQDLHLEKFLPLGLIMSQVNSNMIKNSTRK